MSHELIARSWGLRPSARPIADHIEGSETRRQRECQARDLTWEFIGMDDAFNPLVPPFMGEEEGELGDTPKPSAGRNPCTLLGFRIWDLSTHPQGLTPLHAPAFQDTR